MKNLRWTRILAAFAVLCAGVEPHSAQQTPSPEGVVRINVNLVQVDAVVTDARGRAVTDLTVDDFELYQDGQPQKITGFEFVAVRDSSARPKLSVSIEPGKKSDVVAPPPVRKLLTREEINRTIALVVDDLALSFDSGVRVRDSLKKWVDNEMQTGDLVAVIRTSAGIGSLQRFTMDKQVLHAAIDLIRYHPGRVGTSSFSPVAAPAPTDGVLDTSVFDDEVEHAYLVGSLGAIQYVVRGLRDLPGRKSMVLFSEDMRFTFLEGPGLVLSSAVTQATGEERLRRLADEANRSSVVIYAVDPRGVVFTGLTAEDAGGVEPPQPDPEAEEPPPPTPPPVVADRTTQLIVSRDGMIELTHRTGGLFVHDSNDVGAMLRRAVDDGDGYYLLGYQPEESTFDETGKPKFHSTSVRVKRPGLVVRSRTGFFGRPDYGSSSELLTPQAQIAKALVSPFASEDLPVRLTALFSPSETEMSSISVLLYFDARQLTFAEQADGTRAADVDIAAVTFDADGEQIDTVGKTWRLRVPQQIYEDVLRNGVVYQDFLPVKKAGGYQLRVVARDVASQRLGSAMQFVDVPDVKKGRLTLSGIVMTYGQPALTPGGNPAGETANRTRAEGMPALRVFSPGSSLAYAYKVVNARADAGKSPQLETQIRLFREGQQVYASPMNPVRAEGQVNAKSLAVAGQLQLPKLAGDYILQVIVGDNLRYDKYRIATQAIDFQIRN
jgi:VWFA-related protein